MPENDKTYVNAVTQLDELIIKLGNSEKFPCTVKKEKRSCIQRLQDAGPDEDGRTQFWYGTDCRAAERLCSSCAAYWHVSVARNCLINWWRVTR